MTTSDGAVSAREAARMTGVVERTVRRWIERGKLPAERNADGQFRIQVAALKPFMRDELEPPGCTTVSAANGIVKDHDQEPARAPNHREFGTWMERAIRAEERGRIIQRLYAAGKFNEMAAVIGVVSDLLAGER